MYRLLAFLILFISLSPLVLQAGNTEQQGLIDKIVEHQAQWKKSLSDKVPSNKSPSNKATSSESDSVFSAKIVGGSTTSRGLHPEFALVLFTDDSGNIVNYCGGTLISSNKILTAAHCTYNYASNRTFIIPNFYSFNDDVVDSDIYSVIRKNIHPNYVSSRFDYDVSVLTLVRNSNSPTTKLFDGENLLANFLATIVGVGTLSEGGAAPDNLQAASIPVVSNAICTSSYGAVITDRMLCAGLVSGGRDSCQGDSGGPLWVNFEGQKVQAGITSFGRGCARPNFYGVYSRISSLSAYILENAPDAEFVVEARPNIIPFLQLLLLDEADQEQAICNQSINIGDTINVQFDQLCYDFTNSRYYKSFTFKIDQADRINVIAPQSNITNQNISLFDGTNITGTAIDSDYSYFDEAVLVNDLLAGTYTIEVTSSKIDALIELNLFANECNVSSILVNSTIQSSFNSDCRSIGHYSNIYASYYTFTLDQNKQISISIPPSVNSDEIISLYSGTDTSATPLNSKHSFFHGAVLLSELDAGTYTIEVTSSNPDQLIDLNIVHNICEFSTITIGSTEQKSFSSTCRSIGEYTSRHHYANYYTFTLIQKEKISIAANSQNNYISALALFNEMDVSTAPIKIDGLFQNEAVVLMDLNPGTYTIAVTSENIDDLIDLNLDINTCQPSPIAIDSMVQAGFSGKCRSINDNSHPHARYYTFSLNQSQMVTITSPPSTYFNAYVRLYAGDDISALAIDSDDTYYNMASLVNQLNTGTYTIEITDPNLDATPSLSIISGN